MRRSSVAQCGHQQPHRSRLCSLARTTGQGRQALVIQARWPPASVLPSLRSLRGRRPSLGQDSNSQDLFPGHCAGTWWGGWDGNVQSPRGSPTPGKEERRQLCEFLSSPKTALLNPLSPQTSKLPSTSEAPWRPPVPRVGRSSKAPGGGGDGGLSQPLESPEGRRYSPLPGTQPQTSLLASRRGNGNSAPPTASRSLLPVAPTPPGS